MGHKASSQRAKLRVKRDRNNKWGTEIKDWQTAPCQDDIRGDLDRWNLHCLFGALDFP